MFPRILTLTISMFMVHSYAALQTDGGSLCYDKIQNTTSFVFGIIIATVGDRLPYL